AGPWAVSGPALHIGATALSDTAWHRTTRARLASEAPRLDALARSAGWHPLGGTDLFRLYDVGDSQTTQEALAHHAIWSRRFATQPNWLRLGLPGLGEWPRLEAAMKADTASRQT
ncbi:MAG: threonine-phosphate decarboxylase, partial [Pseudomonadota bacterium]